MRFIIGVVLLASSGLAHAQLAVVPSCGSATYSAGQSKPGTQDTTGTACVSGGGGGGTTSVTGTGTAGTPATGVVTVQGISGGTALPVSSAFATGGATQSGVSCATSNTTLLAAATATFPPVVRNEQSNANAVWVNIAGNAATAAVPNIELLPGQEIDTFVLGYTVTSQINCIAVTGATTITLVYR